MGSIEDVYSKEVPNNVKKAAEELYEYYNEYLERKSDLDAQQASITYTTKMNEVIKKYGLKMKDKELLETYLDKIRNKERYNKNLPSVPENVEKAAKLLLPYYINYQKAADAKNYSDLNEQEASIKRSEEREEVFKKLGLNRADQIIFKEYINVLLNENIKGQSDGR